MMAESKSKEAKYEELLKAMSEGEFGMAKYLWNLIEDVHDTSTISEEKLKKFQTTIDEFIKTFKDRKDGKDGKDGHTPARNELINLLIPLIPKPIPGKTPSRREILELIKPLIPEPIPGPRGEPGKSIRGPAGPMSEHEWNGTLIRFKKPDGTWGEWKNLQGPAGQSNPGAPGVGGMSGLFRVRAEGFVKEGVTEIYFGENLTVTRLGGGNGIRVDAEDGGGGSGGVSLSFETPTGTIDDSNETFTVLNVPIYLVVNGAQYFENVHYTRSGLTITLNDPIGTGGFIRSAYGSGLNVEIPAGTVDDSNTTFTLSNEPKYVVINGAQYFDGAGYTYTAGQIDLNAPVGENGFIRSVY